VLLRVQDPHGEREVRTDHVITGTGFRVNLRLGYLEPSLGRSIAREADGIPASSVPGLFIVGASSAPVFGPIMRFRYGAKHVAPLRASRLRAWRRAPQPSRAAAPRQPRTPNLASCAKAAAARGPAVTRHQL